MFVDDEPTLADIACALLTRLGYQVRVFTDPQRALGAFTEHPGDFDLVITDMAMPRMSGLDLARRLGEVRPGVRIILSTGSCGHCSEEQLRGPGIHSVMRKPFSPAALARTMREAIDAPAACAPAS